MNSQLRETNYAPDKAAVSAFLSLSVCLSVFTPPAPHPRPIHIFSPSRAIKTNQDLLPETPWLNIFYDDFWGTLLTHSGSHKSFRPLCTLSFRLNYAAGGLEPRGYHLVNVVLHSAVAGLFTGVARQLLGHSCWSLLAGLLFAAHPVHTEAVAGVVGRADVGAALFFLLALRCYARHCALRDGVGSRWRAGAWLGACLASSLASMLWKEQGVTALAAAALYDVFVVHRLRLSQLLTILFRVSVCVCVCVCAVLFFVGVL